jgi:hypothetical protein
MQVFACKYMCKHLLAQVFFEDKGKMTGDPGEHIPPGAFEIVR